MENIIEIKDLTVIYPGRIIFENLNLFFKKGSFTTILGANGIGKSTLIKVLSGYLNGNNYIMFEDTPIIKENFSLIKDDVISIIEGKRINYDIRVKDIVKSSLLIKINHLLNREINNLSDEEYYLIRLIEAIDKKPKLLILDNILENIDFKYREIIIKFLLEINKKGTTIINSTNNVEESLLGNYIVLLNESEPIYGPTGAILDNEHLFEYCHIGLPFIIDLSNRLKFYNLIDKNYILLLEYLR